MTSKHIVYNTLPERQPSAVDIIPPLQTHISYKSSFLSSRRPILSCLSASVYLSASSSAHTFLICSLFSLAASRFCRVFSSRRPRRHMLTLYFASVQLPVTFHRKPRAWHSSSAATTSAQPACVSRVRGDSCGDSEVWRVGRGRGRRTLLHFFGVQVRMHCGRAILGVWARIDGAIGKAELYEVVA